MIAAHVQRLYIPSRSAGAPRIRLRELVLHALMRTRQVVCGLTGHSMLLHFEGDRMSLQCFACGVQTPGWTIDVRPQFRRTERHQLRLVRRAA
jgi:hypothetical protein